jgi:hypothetical protein
MRRELNLASKCLPFTRVYLEVRTMAQVGEDRVEVEPGEVVVERKVIPATSRRFSPLALLILVAFVLTCIVVFGGYRLGLREPTPFEKAAENITHVPTPAAPVER